MTGFITIIRGLPGSGKTTLAKALVASGFADCFVEADFWMVDAEGDYSFDPAKLSYCHRKCLDEATTAVTAGRSVVVSNTFVRLWELQPYLDLCPNAQIIECKGKFDNIHGVPDHKMAQMAASWESLDKGETK